ncbi:unnamed protein product, partial [Didymodactylos carnosus]
GFTPSIQKSTYKDVLVQFNTLKCLPVGACAYLLNEASIPQTLDSANSNDEQIQQSLKEYFLYCFLPLPIPSHIPMHVHGCFYLSNESRYNLWKTDNEKDVRRLWNEALAEHLLSQCYVQIVCRAAEQVQKHSLSIERYLTLFVNGTNKKNLMQLLIKNAYETFFSQDLFIIPTLTFESPRIFVWTCASDSKLCFIREFESFIAKSEKWTNYPITECLNSLLLIGLKICDRPELLDLLKNDKNTMYDLNAIKLCDELRVYRGLHQREILPIDRTVFTFNSLYFFLSFILCDEKVQTGKLGDCPLLLRADEKVCSFDEKKPLYGFHNVKTFQRCLYQFMHPSLLDLFGTKELRKRWLKDLRISDLVDILPKVLNKDKFYRNNCEQFVQCKINEDVKRDMLNIWHILLNNLKSFLSDKAISTVTNRNEVKRILLQELDPIKHWCLIPVESHNLRLFSNHSNDDKKKELRFSPFTFVDLMLYQDLSYKSELYYLSKANVQVLDLTFFGDKQDNQPTINILKALVQSIHEPSQVLDVLVTLSVRTPDFYGKLDDDAHKSIFSYCETVFTNLNINQSNESYALKIEQLPIFRNVYGCYEKLERKRRIRVLHGIPLSYLNKISEHLDIQFLTQSDEYSSGLLDKNCKIEQLMACEFYNIVLDCLTKAPVDDRVTHMNYLRTTSNSYGAYNSLKTKLQAFEFITNIDGKVHTASYFYDHDINAFRLALPRERFLPTEFSDKEWISFLLFIGLQNKINEKNALFTMHELNKRNMNDEHGIRAAFEIMRKTEEFSDQFFKQASLIKFIPNSVSEKLMHIIPIPPHLIATQKACTQTKADLCWTEMDILPRELISLDSKILKRFEICDQPQLETIIQCIKKVSQHFSNISGITEENYLNLLSLCQEWCRALIEIDEKNKAELQNLKFIPVKRTNVHDMFSAILVAPEDIFIPSLTWYKTIWPYLFAIDPDNNDYKSGILPFLRSFPVPNQPSRSQCAQILKQFYEKSPKLLDPNDRVSVVTAISYYIDAPKTEIKEQIIYLPNLCSTLISTQELYYIDQTRYKDLITKSKELKQLCFCHTLFENYLDEHNNVSIPVSFLLKVKLEDICKGPQIRTHFSDLKPISDILDQQISDDGIKDNTINISSLTDTIHATEFYYAINRIVQHFFSAQATEENIKRLIQFLNGLEVYITTQPIKEVVFNKKTGQMIADSESECPSHLKDISNNEGMSYLLYISENRSTRRDEHFSKELSKTIQKQCYTIFGDDLYYKRLELFEVICDTLLSDAHEYEAILDRHNLCECKQYDFDDPPYVPKLGTLVSSDDYQYLVQGIYSCAPGEYIAREIRSGDAESDLKDLNITTDYLPEYYHARIIKLVEDHVNDFRKKYQVEIESEKYEIITGLYLYRFSSSSLHEIQTKNNDDVNNKEMMITNMPVTAEDKAHKFKCLETLKEQIDKDVQLIKDLPEGEQAIAIKRLMLRYHPDKNLEQISLYTEAFKYLKQCISRLINGNTVSSDSAYAEAHSDRFTNPSDAGFTYAGRRTNFSWYFTSTNSSGMNSRKKQRRKRDECQQKDPQPSVARKWLLQAYYHLKASRECQKSGIYLWCCITSYYVSH